MFISGLYFSILKRFLGRSATLRYLVAFFGRFFKAETPKRFTRIVVFGISNVTRPDSIQRSLATPCFSAATWWRTTQIGCW